MKEIRILSATGILGSGFREETLKRAMELEPDFIGADSGSTDPGPHYLGSGDTLFSDSAYKRDLRLMLLAGRAAKIPVIVGSACTSGSDPQLEKLVRIAREIAREEKLCVQARRDPQRAGQGLSQAQAARGQDHAARQRAAFRRGGDRPQRAHRRHGGYRAFRRGARATAPKS